MCGLSIACLGSGKNPEQRQIFVMRIMNVFLLCVSGEASDGCNLRLM